MDFALLAANLTIERNWTSVISLVLFLCQLFFFASLLRSATIIPPGFVPRSFVFFLPKVACTYLQLEYSCLHLTKRRTGLLGSLDVLLLVYHLPRALEPC